METMIKLTNSVIVPYVAAVWERLELPANHPAIVIFDAFKGHKGEKITTLLHEKHLHPVLFRNNCTNQLQPIDLVINKPLKDHLQKKFTALYADKVKDQLDKVAVGSL